MNNILAFCMDSLRYDMFMQCNAPTLRGLTEYKKVYSRAGTTIPSLFSVFINLPWYEGGGEKLVPWVKSWGWVPLDLQEKGYQTALVTTNILLKHYQPIFKRGFNRYIVGNIAKGIPWIVETTKKLVNELKAPWFIFILTMETHNPYIIDRTAIGTRDVRNQITAVEYIDPWLKKLLNHVKGTNSEIIVFSDHGDLDLKMEGDYGHGHGTFHPKLFEIPLGRATI